MLQVDLLGQGGYNSYVENLGGYKTLSKKEKKKKKLHWEIP